MADGDILYDEGSIAFLEELWGDGFLSPGRPEEIARMLKSVDLPGMANARHWLQRHGLRREDFIATEAQ